MARPRLRPLGALFALLTASFAAVTGWALSDRQWIVAVAAGALAVWMAELAFRSLR